MARAQGQTRRPGWIGGRDRVKGSSLVSIAEVMADEIAGRIPMNAGQQEVLGVICLRALYRGMFRGLGVMLHPEEIAQAWGWTRWEATEQKRMQRILKLLEVHGLVIRGVETWWMWEGVMEAVGAVLGGGDGEVFLRDMKPLSAGAKVKRARWEREKAERDRVVAAWGDARRVEKRGVDKSGEKE